MIQERETTTAPGKKRRRRHTGKIERAVHLSAWERSGLSGREYARVHGLKCANLYRWRKLQCGGAQERVARPDGGGGGGGSGFLTIDVDRRSFGGTEAMRVVLRRGPLEVEVGGAGSLGELVRAAGQLKREVLDA